LASGHAPIDRARKGSHGPSRQMLHIFDDEQIARLAFAQNIVFRISHGRQISGGNEPSGAWRSCLGYCGQKSSSQVRLADARRAVQEQGRCVARRSASLHEFRQPLHS
jgi:hypothetical protein